MSETFLSPVASEQAKCEGCSDCVIACPVRAIEFEGNKLTFNRRRCAGEVLKVGECLACIMACPVGAITMKEFYLNEK